MHQESKLRKHPGIRPDTGDFCYFALHGFLRKWYVTLFSCCSSEVEWNIKLQHVLYQNGYTKEVWHIVILKGAAQEEEEVTSNVSLAATDLGDSTCQICQQTFPE